MLFWIKWLGINSLRSDTERDLFLSKGLTMQIFRETLWAEGTTSTKGLVSVYV